MSPIQPSPLPTSPGPAAWNDILSTRSNCAVLEGRQPADWLIIGAGFAGLSAARRLRQLHLNDRIVVLEAKRLAEGPAGRNSGFMIDLPHNLTSHDYAGAANRDQIQTEMNRFAINFASDCAQEFEFSKGSFAITGKVNAAATHKGEQLNNDYSKHLKTLSEDFEILNGQQMKEVCGSSYYCNGLFTPGTALLQPAQYVRELADGLISQGVEIFESSPVLSLKKMRHSWIAKSNAGTVEAPKVILAVNGHVESFGFYKRRLMHVTLYGSMTRPLNEEENRQLGGTENWAFTPADPMGTTVRKFHSPQGPRIVIRNRSTWNPNRASRENASKDIVETHEKSFKARFPMLPAVTMEYSWGGLLCLSRNSVSAFGQIDDGLYSACCQNGLGTARGTLLGAQAAELASGNNTMLSEQLLNDPMPQKLPPEPFSSIGAKTFLRWGEFIAGKEM